MPVLFAYAPTSDSIKRSGPQVAGRLLDWRLTFNGQGHATLVEEAGTYTWGVLHEITDDALGVVTSDLSSRDDPYIPVEVQVLGEHSENIRAFTYISPDDQRGVPSEDYLASVVAFARNAHLMNSWIHELERFSVAPASDGSGIVNGGGQSDPPPSPAATASSLVPASKAEAFQTKVASLNKLAATLAGSVAALTGGLTAFGFATGDLDRLYRDHPNWAIIGLMFAGLAVLFGVVAIGYTPEPPLQSSPAAKPDGELEDVSRHGLHFEQGLLIGGGASLAAAFVIFVILLVTGASSPTSKPAINEALSPTSPVLTVEAKSTNVARKYHMDVTVYSLSGSKSKLLATDVGGPDPNGTIDDHITVGTDLGSSSHIVVLAQLVSGDDMPPAPKSVDTNDPCSQVAKTVSCNSVAVPTRSPSAPELQASWDAAAKDVTISINDHDLPVAAAQVLQVQTVPMGTTLYSATLTPDALGAFKFTVSVPVPGPQTVCIFAGPSPLTMPQGCVNPPKDVATALLEVPAEH